MAQKHTSYVMLIDVYVNTVSVNCFKLFKQIINSWNDLIQ